MGNTQTKESRTDAFGQEGSSSPRFQQSESGTAISHLFGRDRDNIDRDRTVESLSERREIKEQRIQQKAERERLAREAERERSIREENCDGGYLVTQGVYTGVEDFSKKIVRHLMIERKLAPFWRGLQDFSPSWTENQLVAVARGKPLPAPDEIPETEPELVKSKKTSNDFSEQVMHNLTVPISARPSSAGNRSYSNDSRARAKTTTEDVLPDFQLREIQLPHDPQINGQPIEAYLYKDASECPICFLYYPGELLNKTRCCVQDICSECFVQVSRKPPHLPEGEQPQGEPTPDHEAQLISEPASCPYCSTPDMGVFYTPPSFSPRGIAYANSKSSSSPSQVKEQVGRKRATSLAAGDPNVVTTDQVRPGWELRLARARAETLRRSAAATALHHAAFLSRGSESRLFGRRAVLRRGIGDSPRGSSSSLGMLALMADRYNAANLEVQEAEAASPGIEGPPRTSSRRNRTEDLEEMMMMEAIRLSLAAEQERQAKEQRQEQKEKKKAEKQRAKDDKKAEKAAKKSGLYLTGSNSSTQLDSSDVKGKEPARPIDVPGRGGSSTESPQSYLERSRAQILVNDSPHSSTIPSTPHRPSHLRNISGVSSSASSFIDATGRRHAGSVSSLDASPNASRINLPADEISGTPPGGGAGLEPMFNFRSLAAMIDDEDKKASSPFVEHSEYATGYLAELPDPLHDELNLASSPAKEGIHPLAQSESIPQVGVQEESSQSGEKSAVKQGTSNEDHRVSYRDIKLVQDPTYSIPNHHNTTQKQTRPNPTMSEKQGRQSPEPSTAPEQTGKSNDGQVGAAPSDTHAKEQSNKQKDNELESNPKHPLDDIADNKISKDGRGPGV